MTIIQVKAVPNASKNSIEGWKEGMLRVKVRAVPEKGKANEALSAFLAERLDLPKSAVRIVSGHTGRIKRVEIEGLSKEEIEKRLQ